MIVIDSKYFQNGRKTAERVSVRLTPDDETPKYS